MDYSSTNRKRELVATLAVLIIIVAIVGAAHAANSKQPTTTVASTSSHTPTTTMPTSGSSNTSTTSTNGGFTDGTYTATGVYNSPGGEEEITVSVTLKDGVVTATSAQSGANDPNAQEYQDQFIAVYKQSVIGKNIVDIDLSRVAGSSLTSQGFNDAIQQIESKAQA